VGSGLVSRCNGGSQAAHTVWENGRGHVFKQYGAGTFAGRDTFLPSTMYVDPKRLISEELALKELGVRRPIQGLHVSKDAPVILPVHAMLCQMLEASRGDVGFGTVGFGVGQAVLDNKRADHMGVIITDLLYKGRLKEKLSVLLKEKTEAAQRILESASAGAKRSVEDIYRNFQDSIQLDRLLRAYLNYGYYFRNNIVGEEYLVDTMLAQNGLSCAVICLGFGDSGKGTIVDFLSRVSDATIFELAQGCLIDPNWSFWPYVSKTPNTFLAVADTIKRSGRKKNLDEAAIENLIKKTVKIGVLRPYQTRHGAGPFVTETKEEALINLWADQGVHNEWQKEFRVGWLDLPALKYSVALNGGLDYLAVTNLDRLFGGPIKVCTSYEYTGDFSSLDRYFVWERRSVTTARILAFRSQNIDNPPQQNGELAGLLFSCRPLDFVNFGRSEQPVDKLPGNIRDFLSFISGPTALNTPVGIISFGPTAEDKLFLSAQRRRRTDEIPR